MDADDAGLEADVEFDRLREGLIWAEVDGFARSAHAARRHVDGTPQLAHLYFVSELSGRLAARFFADADPFEQRYQAIVCRAAGLLHEALAAGKDFEELVEASDESVARLVAALTPDPRLPRPKRYHFLANRVGLAPAAAQLVVLADLRHTAAGLGALLGGPDPPLALVRERTHECRELLAALAKVAREPSCRGPAANLAVLLRDLEQRCRKTRR